MASSRSTFISKLKIHNAFWVITLNAFSFLSADESDVGYNTTLQQPWLTGTLLSPFGYVIEKGHVDIEPFFSSDFTYAAYDKHWHKHSENLFSSISAQPFFWYGFAHRLDIEIAPQFSWNHTSGASHWVLNDLPIELEYQLVYEQPGKWYPAVKLAFLLTFPTGKYQKLDPKDKETDRGGFGNWYPGIELVFQRLVHLSGMHFLDLHFTLEYTIPTSVHVKGLNAYGGGKGTRGTVYPGPLFLTIFGLEYTFTKNWALAFDAQYEHSARTRFTGHKGSTEGTPNPIGAPSSEQFSLAPAIEYNWSENLGLIAGVWFTVAGRNTFAFATGIIAINVYI